MPDTRIRRFMECPTHPRASVTAEPGDIVRCSLCGMETREVEYVRSEVTNEMVERASEGVVKAHEDEMQAYLRGDVPANQWRPEVYARAALTAALTPSRVEEE